jgi:hypothetical protein
MIRRLIVPLAVAVATFHASQILAQGAFPAPLPGRAGTANDPAFPPVNARAAAPANDPAFPPVNGGAASSSFPVQGAAPFGGGGGPGAFSPAGPSQQGQEDCMKGFMPLRTEAEKRGKLIKVASERHAPAEEACKLIGNFGVAEVKMLKYVETHMSQCGIPPQVLDQLKTGHKNTEGMQQKVCSMAQQQGQQRAGPAGPSLSEVLGSAAALPEATPNKKGSTFDTLNGNVLSR